MTPPLNPSDPDNLADHVEQITGHTLTKDQRIAINDIAWSIYINGEQSGWERGYDSGRDCGDDW